VDRDNRSTDTQLASLWSKAAIVLYWAVIFLTITWAIVTRDPSFKTIVFLLFIGLLAGALPLERYAGNLRVRGFALQANHDALTGLANRRVFTSQLASMLRKRRFGIALAVLILDLDRFKTINDTLGHAAGDQLLKLVADRLRKFGAGVWLLVWVAMNSGCSEMAGKEDLVSCQRSRRGH
jgi:GGDEF domain-containing protein